MKSTMLRGEADGETNSPGLAQIRYSVIFYIPHYVRGVVDGQPVNFHFKDLNTTAVNQCTEQAYDHDRRIDTISHEGLAVLKH